MIDLSPLFRPMKLGSLELPNRIAMAPMTRRRSPGHTPGPDMAAYYARRARGGVGLIVTEGTTIDHPAASPDAAVPAFHGPALEGWKQVRSHVHAAGGRIMPQLWHLGMVRHAASSPNPDQASVGPSDLGQQWGWAARRLADEEIQDIVNAFARAAAEARALGFDGVELHGAHGYLIDQFFWAQTNDRSDSWGGDAIARTRFGVEVIRAVRQAVGSEFPVVLRWSQWKTTDYAAKLAETPLELERFLAPLTEAGVTAFHCSTRRFWEPEFPDAGETLNLAGWTKKITGVPTISVGSVGLSREDDRANRKARISASVGHLETLAGMLRQGDFDLIAIGRALLANPEWPRLVREGRFSELEDYSAAALEALT